MFLVHSMLVDLKTKLVSPCVTMYFLCSSLSKWWNLCSKVVKKLIYLWSVWHGLITISLCNWMTVESWIQRILLRHWAHYWANPSWSNSGFKNMEYSDMWIFGTWFCPIHFWTPENKIKWVVTSRLSWTLAFFIAWWPEIEWHVFMISAQI